MAITAYAGTPGSGKSYALTHHALEGLALGKSIYANYGFVSENVYRWLRRYKNHSHRDACAATLRIHQLRTYEDLVGVHDAVLCLDECHDWLNARSYQVIPHEVISWWSQHRHAKVDVYIASQRMGSVDAHVRSLVAHTYLARPLPWWVSALLNIKNISRGRSRRPYLRLTEIQDDATGMLGDAKGLFLGITRNQFLGLDYQIARCYDTHGGVFSSPLHALERATSKHKHITGDLTFEFKKHRKASGHRAIDGRPFLAWREYAELVASGLSPSAELESHLQITYAPTDRDLDLVERARDRDLLDLDLAERYLLDSDAELLDLDLDLLDLDDTDRDLEQVAAPSQSRDAFGWA